MDTETLYLPLAEGLQARLEIQILVEPAIPTPGERQTRRAPTLRELDALAAALTRRDYRFTPVS